MTGNTIRTRRKIRGACLVVIFLVSVSPLAVRAQRGLKRSIWNVPGILETSAYRVLERDSVLSRVYDGLPYQGHPSQVFAYYATPATAGLYHGPRKAFPGIVLVHGGGGKAFKEWALLWARKGYAAIAMDLRGNGGDGRHLEGGFVEPHGETPYFAITPSIYDQWMFQAVADVLLAHNLLRSFPEVDTSRTALTGISWGGVITCIVAGLDPRFKAAVPVYGCGYLWRSGRMEAQLDRLTAGERSTWIRQYDPAGYLKNASMPMLFLNDAQDPYFALPSYMKSYRDAPDAILSLKPGLKHSHHAGWSNDEIYYFVNHHLNGSPGLARVGKAVRRKDMVSAAVDVPVALKSAQLWYTQDTSVSGENRKWLTISAEVQDHRLSCACPPAGTTMYYFSVEDTRGAQTSGAVRFLPAR